jgi:acetyltransferase
MSHTGTLAGEDAVFDACLARAGAVRVPNIPALRAACRALLHYRPMQGPRLAIVSCTGAAGIIGADACEEYGLQLAPFPERLQAELQVPRLDWYRLHNPADIWPQAMASGNYIDFMSRSVLGFLRQETVDGLLAILVAMDSPLHADHDLVAAARALSAANSERKPLALWLYGSGARRQSEAINAERLPGVACFGDIDGALAGLTATWKRTELSRRTRPTTTVLSPRQAELPPSSPVMGAAAESFLGAYGFRFAPGGFAGDPGQAASFADEIGYPVVLKIISPDWLHKSDGGGVLLDVRDPRGVEEGFKTLREHFSSHTPEGTLDAIHVQKQMHGIEMLLGVKRDAEYGPIIAVGMGGIHTETFADVVLEPVPVWTENANRMLSELRMAPLLDGARGTQVDRSALLHLMTRLSAMTLLHPEIAELDINPLIVSEAGCYCVDARIIRTRRD